MSWIFLPGKSRELEIHEAVVADISQQIRATANRQINCPRLILDTNRICAVSCRGVEEVKNRLFDLHPTVCVGDQVYIRCVIFENTAFEDLVLGSSLATDPLPVRGTREECLHSICRSPIKITLGVFSVSEYRRNRNNALMLIVGKGDKDVYSSQLRGLCINRDAEYAGNREHVQYAAPHHAPPVTSRNKSTAYNAPSGVSSCLK